MTLSEFIYKVRVSRKMNQKQFAEAVGTTNITVSHLETGKQLSVSSSLKEKISSILTEQEKSQFDLILAAKPLVYPFNPKAHYQEVELPINRVRGWFESAGAECRPVTGSYNVFSMSLPYSSSNNKTVAVSCALSLPDLYQVCADIGFSLGTLGLINRFIVILFLKKYELSRAYTHICNQFLIQHHSLDQMPFDFTILFFDEEERRFVREEEIITRTDGRGLFDLDSNDEEIKVKAKCLYADWKRVLGV